MGQFVSHDPTYSWEILRRLGEFRSHGITAPLLIGTSRKGFLAEVSNTPLAKRDPLSQLTALAAHLKGAQIVRTHNVRMAEDFFAVWRKLHC